MPALPSPALPTTSIPARETAKRNKLRRSAESSINTTRSGCFRLATVIDVFVSQRRDIASARTFFTAALTVHGDPTVVITDRAPASANVIEELLPAALHNTSQYENNRVECDHGRLRHS